MKVELKVRQGSQETQISIEGYYTMVEALLKAIKEAIREEDSMAEIK